MKSNNWTTQESIELWKEIIEDRAQSGLTIKDYCSANGIKTTTYYYWQRKIRANQIQDMENKAASSAVKAEIEGSSLDPKDGPAPIHKNKRKAAAQPAQTAVVFNLKPENPVQAEAESELIAFSNKKAASLRGSHAGNAVNTVKDVIVRNAPASWDSGPGSGRDRFTDVPITINAGKLKVLISQHANPELVSMVVRALVC